jgi:protein CpxP
MKRVIKLLSVIVLLLLAFTINTSAQEMHHRKERKEMIKKLDLTKQQKHELKAFHQSIKQQKKAIDNNTALTLEQKKSQQEALMEKRHQKLEAILTPEQKEKMKELKKDTPRRGVTNMPNERTVK